MNTQHKLLEQLNGGALLYAHELEHVFGSGRSLAPIKEACQNAIGFYIGGFENYLEIEDRGVGINLPYSQCWFEIACPGVADVGILANQNESISGLIFLRDKDTAGLWAVLAAFDKLSSRDGKVWASVSDNPDADLVGSICHGLGVFLQMLGCKSVRIEKKSIDPKVKQSREKRNKLPLFEYRNTYIDLESAGGGGNGIGTHASPRVHTRRGHWRRLFEGKSIWINEHVVGSKSRGLIAKQYSVKPSRGRRDH